MKRITRLLKQHGIIPESMTSDGKNLYVKEKFEDIVNAMEDHAEKEALSFYKWRSELKPNQLTTVHPPSGSGGGFGIYDLPEEDLYKKFKNKQDNGFNG